MNTWDVGADGLNGIFLKFEIEGSRKTGKSVTTVYSTEMSLRRIRDS